MILELKGCACCCTEVRERLAAGKPPMEVSEWLEASAPVALRTQPAFVREIVLGVLGGVLPDARVRLLSTWTGAACDKNRLVRPWLGGSSEIFDRRQAAASSAHAAPAPAAFSPQSDPPCASCAACHYCDRILQSSISLPSGRRGSNLICRDMPLLLT